MVSRSPVPLAPDAEFRAKLHRRFGQGEIEPETLAVSWDPLEDTFNTSTSGPSPREIKVEPIDFSNAPLDILFPSPRYVALCREEKRQLQRQRLAPVAFSSKSPKQTPRPTTAFESPSAIGALKTQITQLRDAVAGLQKQQAILQEKLDRALTELRSRSEGEIPFRPSPSLDSSPTDKQSQAGASETEQQHHHHHQPVRRHSAPTPLLAQNGTRDRRGRRNKRKFERWESLDKHRSRWQQMRSNFSLWRGFSFGKFATPG